ncbi:MAG: AMP-binding protein [Hyphomicrobiaceae bacterium]
MRDYQTAYREMSVASAEKDFLEGRLGAGLNAAIECCDRWASDGRIALEWIGRDAARETVTFAALKADSERFASLLKKRDIGSGDIVAGLLPRIPELLTVVLGTWRAGAVYQPLFTAFGPKAIETRIAGDSGSGAKLVITDGANLSKLADVQDCPPIIEVDRTGMKEGTLPHLLAAEPTGFAPVMLEGDEPFVLLYTSGTTGKPKAVLYPLAMLLPVGIYMRDAIDLRPDDRYWNIADPGWAYGMLYALVGPLLLGHTTTFYEGGFTVEATMRIVRDLRITNFAGAPTAYRMLMAAGPEAAKVAAGTLRVASSAGEPLNPEVARWAKAALGVPLKDHYGQTETAMLVNNHHALQHPEKEGSAGYAMPGFHLEVLGDDLKPAAPGTPGILAVDLARSPLNTFTGYWRAETPAIQGKWYLTGDTMMRDVDGHFFFVGRSDDIITSAGYRIGPFDVESALIEHPAVAEVGVIGKPDPERTEIVKAFIVLKAGYSGSPELTAELQEHVRRRLATHAFPREIAYLAELPKTPSGKIQRFVLRQMG